MFSLLDLISLLIELFIFVKSFCLTIYSSNNECRRRWYTLRSYNEALNWGPSYTKFFMWSKIFLGLHVAQIMLMSSCGPMYNEAFMWHKLDCGLRVAQVRLRPLCCTIYTGTFMWPKLYWGLHVGQVILRPSCGPSYTEVFTWPSDTEACMWPSYTGTFRCPKIYWGLHVTKFYT